MQGASPSSIGPSRNDRLIRSFPAMPLRSPIAPITKSDRFFSAALRDNDPEIFAAIG